MSKYQFNRDQLRFMEVGRSIKDLIQKVVLAIVVSLALAVLYYFLFSSFFNTPEEQQLIRESRVITQVYEQLQEKMEALDVVLDDLEERDRDIYRTLFKSDPPDIEFETQSLMTIQALSSSRNFNLVHQTDTLYRRLEQKADRINRLFRAIALSISSEQIGTIPDVIPLRDFDVVRVGATIGERIHPFYKTIRMHTGLDFPAALGADVLAPANGMVTSVVSSQRGDGNTVIIEHAFGYQTVYKHLINVLVRKGQTITKGMIIARAGNSGMSLAPHLHYEVWRNGEMLNPIHFSYAQLTPDVYWQLMVAGYNSGQSLD